MPSLSIEEIEEVAKLFKEQLTMECERSVRRGDNPSALAALMGKEYVDKFVYNLKLTAGAPWRNPVPSRARPIRLPKKSA